jgi:hypothetical protein
MDDAMTTPVPISPISTQASPASPSASSSFKDVLAPIIGILILLAFAVFVGYLLVNLDISEREWTRAIFLLAGVEAVAFAAAGYFFGSQVQRGRVEEAKQEAQAAGQVKDAAQETARAERRASKVLAEGVVQAEEAGGLLSGGDDRVTSSLVAQARALLAD